MVGYICSMYRFWRNWKALPVSNWIMAAEEFQKRNYPKAITLYKAGLKRHPRHPAASSAQLDLAFCQQQRSDYRGAIETLKDLVLSQGDCREAVLRLHKLLRDVGQNKEAAWVIRRYIRANGPDADLVARMILALIACDATEAMLSEPLEMRERISGASQSGLTKLAETMIGIKKKDAAARQELWKLASSSEACKETLLSYAEVLLGEGKIALARQTLRRAHGADRNCCRTLVLFAKSYLSSGPFYSPEDARQLAEQACLVSGWGSLAAVHILAESYHHLEDATNALLVAYKGKDLMRGNGSDNESVLVEQLIHNLSESH